MIDVGLLTSQCGAAVVVVVAATFLGYGGIDLTVCSALCASVWFTEASMRANDLL